MNIFFLHPSIRRCARWHCDKHVVKMILEYTQILYTCNHVNGGTDKILASAPICLSTGQHGYKAHAIRHPSVLWACESLAHYMWLLALAMQLVQEHSHRFQPLRIHACYEHLLWLQKNPPKGLRICTWLRDPPPAMPDEFRLGDSVASYRAYYNGAKKHILRYTRRHRPHILL